MRQDWSISDIEPEISLERELTIRNFELLPRSAINPHRHDWGQLLYASKDVLWAETSHENYFIPPLYALWVPADEEHATVAPHGASFRGLYIEGNLLKGFQKQSYVINVSPLMRELIARFTRFPQQYEIKGSQGRLVTTSIDELLLAPRVDLYLPMPAEGDVLKIVESLLESPGDSVTAVSLELGYDSPSSFSVMFKRLMACSLTEYLVQENLR